MRACVCVYGAVDVGKYDPCICVEIFVSKTMKLKSMGEE